MVSDITPSCSLPCRPICTVCRTSSLVRYGASWVTGEPRPSSRYPGNIKLRTAEIGTWNVKTMFHKGNWKRASAGNEQNEDKHTIGGNEMRWAGAGKKTSEQYTIMYSTPEG